MSRHTLHTSPYLRFAVLLVAVTAIDGVVVWFAKRPLPWAAMIPGLIPLLVYPVVIRPMIRRR